MYNYITIPVKTENTFQWSSGFLNDSYTMSNNKLIRNLNCFLKSDLQILPQIKFWFVYHTEIFILNLQ